MHGVERTRLALVELRHTRGDDRKACRLKTPVDLPDQIAGDSVGFDYGKRALKRHSMTFRGK